MASKLDAHATLQAAVATAEAECNAGNWQRGFDNYIKLLRSRLLLMQPIDFESTTLTSADAVILERTAELAVLLGQAPAADCLFAGLISAFKRAGNRFASDCAALKRLHLAISQGNQAKIEENLSELEPTIGAFEQIAFDPVGLDAWEHERFSWCSIDQNSRVFFLKHFYLESGRLFSWIGQYHDSVGALKRGLSLQEKSDDRVPDRVKTSLRLELAAAMLEMGDMLAIDPIFEDLKLMISAGRQPGYAVRCWELNAQCCIMRGDFGRALALLEKVREFCRKNGFLYGELTAGLNLTEVLILVNQTVAAREIIAEISETATRLNIESVRTRSERLRRLAEVRRKSRRDAILIAPPVSEFWRRQIRKDAQSSGEISEVCLGQSDSSGFLARFNEYALSFQWLLDQRQVGAAKELLSQMREIFGESDSQIIQIRIRVLEGIQRFQAGLTESAAAMLAAACAELRKLGLKHELWQTCRFVQWSQQRLAKTQEGQNLGFSDEAEKLLSEMTASLKPEHRALFFLNKWTVDEERLSEQLDSLVGDNQAIKRLPLPLRWFAYWRVCFHAFTLELEANQIRTASVREHLGETEMSQRFRGIAAFFGRILRHPASRATLSFFVFPDRLLIIRTTFFSIRFGVTPASRGELREMVGALHRAFSRGERGVLEALQASEEIGDILQLSELLGRLPKRVRSLIIIPDDVLYGVPFAAIIANGRPIVQSHSVTVQTSLPSREAPVKSFGPLSIVSAGVSETMANLPALPGVLKEIQEVSDLFSQHGMEVLALLNVDATKANIIKHLGVRSIIHLACHGVFARDDLERTGLALRSDQGGVELVSLLDLAKLDLTKVEHLTLASCWSADNYILPGRWILSLPQVALLAGAKSVLGSLWPLDDKIAAAFARRFYEHLFLAPRDEALRLTQLECLQNRLFRRCEINTSDAFYWAGFTLFGDPTRIMSGKAKPTPS